MDSMKNQHAPTLIICARTRYNKEDFLSVQFRDSSIIVFPCRPDDVSPHTDSTQPLVWHNNEENKDTDYSLCHFCLRGLENTSGYYKCKEDKLYGNTIAFHKECIKPMANYPYHPKHSLQILIFESDVTTKVCYCCSLDKKYLHYCSLCNFSICRECAKKPLLLTIDNKKRHEHTLSYIPREASMICDVCALDDRRYFIYICHQCDFVVHKECIYSPCMIKIARHQHRLSFTSSFLPGNRFCGVCRGKFNDNYGGYACVKGCYYVVHSKCARHKDVWDGKELDGEPEAAYEDTTPFLEISDGIIKHFNHNHYMRLHEEIDQANEKNISCQACAVSIYDGDIFSCMECNFVLHKACAYLPSKKHHVMHPHPLVLQDSNNLLTWLKCSACNCKFNSFRYKCEREDCNFNLDVRCASLSEPVNNQSHPHPLFLPSKPGSERICSICQERLENRLDCGECDFVMCFRCATLPHKFMYKHDDHPLIFSYEQDSYDKYWCDLCEKKINPKKGVYKCNDCDITLHVKCLIGDEMYVLPSKPVVYDDYRRYEVIPNNRLTRYICKQCDQRCQNKLVYKMSCVVICCSIECLYRMRAQY